MVSYPAACSECRGTGSRIVTPRFCPRHLEAWYLCHTPCRRCRGTGRMDFAGPSDVELAREWDRGGGFPVPSEILETDDRNVA